MGQNISYSTRASFLTLCILQCLLVAHKYLWCLCYLLLASVGEEVWPFLQEWVGHLRLFKRVFVWEGELVNRHIPLFIRKVETSADLVIDWSVSCAAEATSEHIFSFDARDKAPVPRDMFIFIGHGGVVLNLSYGFGDEACVAGDATFASLWLSHN